VPGGTVVASNYSFRTS